MDSGRLGTHPDAVDAVLKAMGMMRYAALGISRTDYTIGRPFFAAARKYQVPLFSASGLAQAADPGVDPLLWATVGKRRLAVTSTFATGRDPAHTPDQELRRLADVLRPVRQNADVVILLSQLGLPFDKQVGTAPDTAGLVDIVIGGQTEQDLTEPLWSGDTMIVPTSIQGKRIGVIQIAFGMRGRLRVTVHLETVSTELPSDSDVSLAIRDAVVRQQRRQAEVALSSTPAKAYVGAETCGQCHGPQFTQWRSTRHARAVETLRTDNRLEPGCLPCHSDRYRRLREFPTERANVEGVECITCHGAGRSHTDGQRPGDVVRVVGKDTCVTCHNPAEDHDFDYERDIVRVSH